MTKNTKKTKVYVNGSLIGFHDDPEKLKKEFMIKRRDGTIDPQINFSYFKDTKEIFINTDSGRIQRPLIIVENGKPKLTEENIAQIKEGKIDWHDLIVKGIVEYIDAEEEENIYVALEEADLTPEHTHLEISGTAIFSFVTAMIPFIEHNLAGKALHGAKQYKQGIGLPVANYNLRMDTELHVLYYPQIPLVKTRVDDIIKIEKRPLVQNAVVAIMPYEGFNIIDAYVFNKGSVDRAFGRSSYYRAYKTLERRYPSGQTDKFTIPTEDCIGHKGEEDYKNLDETGIVNIESFIDKGGVIVGKTSPPRFVEEVSDFGVVSEERRDTSECIKKHLHGYVDRLFITEMTDGTKLAKIKIRTPLIPETGDKFSSHHAQKGVIGAVVPEEDMPFTSSGMKPDIILGPHSIPSRMTLGQLLESVAGKAVSLTGEQIDGTAYYNDKEYVFKQLEEFGFRYDGKEVFYSGKTGEKIEMPIFVGPLAYQRLNTHLAINKIQARDKGPVQLLTRQPTEGKQKEGGQKFGEMEGEALVSHGTAMTLYEKLMDSSDEIFLLFCEDCGIPATNDKIRNKKFCPICKGENISYIKTSYGFKVLLYELISMGIFPKILIGDKID